MIKHSRGFTLMEVLIALMILAIIGAIMMRGLQSAIRSQERINQNAAKLAALQEGMTIMARDIEEIINRPIFTTNGSLLPAVIASNNYIEFTTIGLANPFGMYQRSSLQRIAYQCHDGTLFRLVWPTIDRMPGSSPDSYPLLTEVSDCRIQLYFNPTKQKQLVANTVTKTGSTSPTTASAINKPPPLPNAVQISFTIKGVGTVTRFVALPG